MLGRWLDNEVILRLARIAGLTCVNAIVEGTEKELLLFARGIELAVQEKSSMHQPGFSLALRRYSIDEIDGMRQSLIAIGVPHCDQWRVDIEHRLQTHIIAGTDPKELMDRAVAVARLSPAQIQSDPPYLGTGR
jgi:hypothetical protein